ncbi:hypothetical protein BH10PSE11_BH10PSE11_30870 [soil metagenome]
MQKYFFDTKDGVTVRDRFGMIFKFDSEAIEHSILLAKKMRLKGTIEESDLRISVVNELGDIVHVEMVGPNAAHLPT